MTKPAVGDEMTVKETAFVQEYLIDLNQTDAAIRAGYSAKTAKQIGHQLMQRPRVKAAIDAAMAERAERTEINQDWVLKRLVEVAERCMQHEPVTDRKGEHIEVELPDGQMAKAYTFNATGATSALALIAKHTGGFVDRRELSGPGGGPIQTEGKLSIDPSALTDDDLRALARIPVRTG